MVASTRGVVPGLRAEFRAVATTIVPDAAALDRAGWTDVEALVEAALARRPAGLRRRLRVFIRMLQWLPVLRYGRCLTSLDTARRRRVLAAFQDAPLLVLRQGFWGLRTLVLLGYYGREAAAVGVGYRAHPRGWEAQR